MKSCQDPVRRTELFFSRTCYVRNEPEEQSTLSTSLSSLAPLHILSVSNQLLKFKQSITLNVWNLKYHATPKCSKFNYNVHMRSQTWRNVDITLFHNYAIENEHWKDGCDHFFFSLPSTFACRILVSSLFIHFIQTDYLVWSGVYE